MNREAWQAIQSPGSQSVGCEWRAEVPEAAYAASYLMLSHLWVLLPRPQGPGGWGSQVKSEGLGSDWLAGVVEVKPGALWETVLSTLPCAGLSSARVGSYPSAAWTSPQNFCHSWD